VLAVAVPDRSARSGRPDAYADEAAWRNGSMDLVEACHQVAAAGLVVGTAGNVSVRAGDRVSLTAKGVALGEVGADDIAVADLDGQASPWPS
jgi:class II aldolase/adducin N-terminal domain-containing protein